ncbi:hypothetical protein RHGRI_023870 [Rhododendron griersonianum]|uniref:Endonuclease/exonuclease/phosphatase domain-containing protein n=1 Tax=Rhododendron griersonianum TaxID=479676 RepID=A0AAV6J999_9ERIC|nr:hypothetical protein RHGRI_023870 [Rhododendron griersonianum]
MGCSREAASSWLCTCPPTTTTTTATSTSFKLKPFFLKPAISCSIKGPSDSTSSSSAASSYSLHRIRKFGRRLPDIVRHWVQADSPIPSDDKGVYIHSPLHSCTSRFMVVSYNILGDRNASKHKDLYRNVPSLYMNWDRRKRIICEELIGWNPDIICLQEVDRYFDLLNIMQKAGYIGSFKVSLLFWVVSLTRRTGDSIDGCAMLWKADKFRLLECESIEFKRYNLRDNVAQLSVFEGSINWAAP